MKLLSRLAPLLLAPLAAFAGDAAPTPAADPATLAAAGNTDWRADRKAEAVLSWERSLALDSRQSAALAGLAVAQDAGLRRPAESRIESYSAPIPPDAWALALASSAWIAIIVLTLPFISRIKAGGLTHGVAAFAGAIAILAAPGFFGARRRLDRAVVIRPASPVLSSPTQSGETVSTLAAGDVVRITDVHGSHSRVVTSDFAGGWIATSNLARVIPPRE